MLNDQMNPIIYPPEDGKFDPVIIEGNPNSE